MRLPLEVGTVTIVAAQRGRVCTGCLLAPQRSHRCGCASPAPRLCNPRPPTLRPGSAPRAHMAAAAKGSPTRCLHSGIATRLVAVQTAELRVPHTVPEHIDS
jgi:hypothetical protein